MGCHSNLKIEVLEHIQVDAKGNLEASKIELQGCPNCLAKTIANYMISDPTVENLFFSAIAYFQMLNQERQAAANTKGSDELLNYAVYKDPTDFPGQYVCRIWRIKMGAAVADAEPFKVTSDVEEIYETLRNMGLTLVPPVPGDDPKIVAVYI